MSSSEEGVAHKEPQSRDPRPLDDQVGRRQLRENAKRSLAVNLAEGLALSEYLSKFPEDERPSSSEALEVIRAKNTED